MSMVSAWKARIRSSVFYKPVLRRRAKLQEESYRLLREKYFRAFPDFFAVPGYRERMHARLMERLPRPPVEKKDAGGVRLFVVGKPGMEGPWMESEIERNFDATFFSVPRHMRGFQRGEKGLLEKSLGVDLEDRKHPSSFWGKGEKESWLAQLERDILQAVGQSHRQCPLDLVFIYGGYGEIAPSALRQIRSWGIPIAILSLDDKHSFLGNRRGGPYGPEGLTAHYDVHLTNSLECLRWYAAEGVPAYYFPQAADPELCRPSPEVRDIEVCFIGQAYGARGEFARTLRRAGIPLQCFGAGWENGRVEKREEIYRRSLITLGIGGTGQSDRLTCVKSRDFEAPACGSLYLTTYDRELARLFHVGREILCYLSEFDCVEQIRRCLANPEEARAIGEAGRNRYLREHTWTHRMGSLLRWMGILAPGGDSLLSG